MLKCPECKTSTFVVDSRDYKTYVRRRRLCPKCKRRFTTYEVINSLRNPAIARYRKRNPGDHRSDEDILKSIRTNI